MRPSAKKFFERSASRDVTPSIPFSASTVIDESATGVHVEVGERAVLERVRLVARLLEVPLVERVRVRDERPALREVADVHLERRRVHRDEDARLVARREDVVVGEVDLEARHAGSEPAGARISAGKSGSVARSFPKSGRLAREAIARELHPVAGVAGEPDHDPFEVLDGLAVATVEV